MLAKDEHPAAVERFAPAPGRRADHTARMSALANPPTAVDVYWYYRDAFFALVPPAGRVTLEVGFGEGRVSRDLVARGHRVTGVDVSRTLTLGLGDRRQIELSPVVVRFMAHSINRGLN